MQRWLTSNNSLTSRLPAHIIKIKFKGPRGAADLPFSTSLSVWARHEKLRYGFAHIAISVLRTPDKELTVHPFLGLFHSGFDLYCLLSGAGAGHRSCHRGKCLLRQGQYLSVWRQGRHRPTS